MWKEKPLLVARKEGVGGTEAMRGRTQTKQQAPQFQLQTVLVGSSERQTLKECQQSPQQSRFFDIVLLQFFALQNPCHLRVAT